MALFRIASSSIIAVIGFSDDTIQLMQSSMMTGAQASVDAAGNIQSEVRAEMGTTEEENFIQSEVRGEMGTTEEENFLPCKVWYYSQSNCMFNLGSTAGDMKQFGYKVKSFRMTRSSGPRGKACAVESYSGTGFTGTKTVYTKGECVKTNNGYGKSKSYRLLGNPRPTTTTTTKPKPCSTGHLAGYWVSKFKRAGVSPDQISKICYANSQWYYNGVSTRVGMGGWNVNCNNKVFKCAGGRKFGYGANQAKEVKKAIDNGGVAALVELEAVSTDGVGIEDASSVAEEMDEEIDGWKLYEVVEAEAEKQEQM